MSARATVEQVAEENGWIVQRSTGLVRCTRGRAVVTVEFNRSGSLQRAFRYDTPNVDRLGNTIMSGIPGILLELRRER